MKIIGANITGSFILNNQDVTTTIQTSNVWSGSVATDITALNAATASLNDATASLLSYTASNNATISDILLETASFNAFSSSILSYTASNNAVIADILLETASLNAATASLLSYTASQNSRNGTYATTGSNTFAGIQTVNSNLVVTGSITAQTLVVQTITSSQDFVTGSTKFGSLLSNTHQFTGSVIVTGSLNATAFTGSGAGLTSIPNAALTNSTISGIALGSNLATLTIGTGLSGTSYNGSGAVTIANTGVTSNVAGTGITVSGATGAVTITNSGVTSIVAGTGISINQGTGAVTVTNTITNNNQLTNGAGYITGLAWSGVGSGYRENYDLGFRPADNSSSYAGFKFASPGNDANAGYFLVRGGGDNDVYTQNGLTIVADLGWLTLAQRSTADRGVRIMTGTTSATRISVTDATTTINNTLTAGGTINIDGSLRFQSSDSRRLYGASVGSGYNCVRVQGNWETFDIMGRVIDWTGSNLHFGNGYNGVDHSASYAVLGNPVSYFKVEGPIYATGDIIAYYSDRRLKQNIQPINSALDILNKIGAYTFEWNKKSEDIWAKKEGDKDFGLISQEVEEVWPMGVVMQGAKDINDKYGYGDPNSEYYDPLHIEKNPEEYKTVRYDKMVTLAIAAIKEQQSQIEELKSIINGLTK